MSQYRCKYFKIHELVEPDFLNEVGETRAWEVFDVNLLIAIDLLKENLSPNNPVTCNDWYWGGRFDGRGFRTVANYSSERAYIRSRSQHKFGRAVDLIFDNGMTIPEIHQWLDDNWFDICPDIKITYEVKDDMSWLHLDVRNTRYPSHVSHFRV